MPLNAIILAQANSTQFKVLYLLGVLVFGFILPFVIGNLITRRLRMPDYGWKVGVILCSLVVAAIIVARTWNPETNAFEIKLGVDLKGGVILIYEVDEEASLAAMDSTAGGGNQGDAAMANLGALVEALSRRINPSGTKEIVIRPYGERQVEIIIPEVDSQEVETIKKRISTAGVLQFRIVANPRDHADIIAAAQQMAENPVKKGGSIVRDEAGNAIGLWARVAREQEQVDPDRPYKLSASSFIVRNASTGDIIEIPSFNRGSEAEEIAAMRAYLEERGIEQIDVLMATNDMYDVTGAHLGAISQGTDELLNPCINFNLKGEGVDLFANLTRDYAPDGQFKRQLGILLDNELLSAPNIQEMIVGRGRITGRFTSEEVAFMVNILQAGSLPVILNPDPISENVIDPTLGRDTIDQGRWAISIALALVLIFIVFYYRFAGIVAAAALLANLLFILALMVAIQAAFTLPGLAGLVLTVGMSVDANVLIFERIREELSRGAALRMAIRNGFARATTTIVDANVTTLITAIVLYAIGTDQIRGFAVTLILGILMSMYTAIFCSRVIFDLAERARRMSVLNMSSILGTTQIDFLAKRRLAAVVSLLLIGIGIAGIVARGADIFDIDFRGGTSVHLVLDQPMETADVRETLKTEFDEASASRTSSIRFTLTAMNTGGSAANKVFKVDSSVADIDDLQQIIQKAFRKPDGGNQLATYSLSYGELKEEIPATPESPADDETASTDDDPAAVANEADPPGEPSTDPAPPASSPQADASGGTPEERTDIPASTEPGEPDEKDGAAANLPADNLLALAGPLPAGLLQGAEEVSDPQPPEDEPAAAPEKAETESSPAAADSEPRSETSGQSPVEPAGAKSGAAEEASTEAPAPGAEPSEADAGDGGEADSQAADSQAGADLASQSLIEVELSFGHGINYETLRDQLDTAINELDLPISYYEVTNPERTGGSSAYQSWELSIAAEREQVTDLLEYLQNEFAETPVWASSNKIGSQVADRMQNKAIYALLASLLGIVVYVWIRFQRVIFGLAAVVALVHDVLITLGAIALSYWLAGVFGFLLIEEFKISLPIVAALLTIIGYSLNDTIVVFDRIREVRGKSPDLTDEMINVSINQTLSRTLLTSMTTLIVVVILYALGGDGIHGFAFALVVGVTVGTYSSIFVASPVLLWMTGGKSRSHKSATT